MRGIFAALVFGTALAWAGEPASREETAEFWRKQSIYQLLTDRFFNGDRSNDDAGGRFSPAKPWGAHGGDFAGIAAKLDYIKALGATAVWISPILLNGGGHYHAYATTDFYKVQPAFGTVEELKKLVAEAHKRGLLVVGDVVTNHGGHWIDSDEEGWPEFRAPPAGYRLNLREGRRYAPPFDHIALGVPLEEIFHNHGATRNWDDPTEVELGELMGLDDFRTTSPFVREKMAEIYSHWIREIGFDAFRIDTVKHVEMDFWDEWNPAIRKAAAEAGRPKFFQFGEVLERPEERCGPYTQENAGGEARMDSVLDYPLYYTVQEVFAKGKAAPSRLVERASEERLAHYHPLARDALVTFLDNHDHTRFLHQGPAAADRLDAALAFLLTSRGIPCLYYGTEQDFDGGRDPFNRENMFDGDFEQGPSEGDNFNMTHPRFQLVARLNNLRRIHPALTAGNHAFLEAASDGPGVLGYQRETDAERVWVFLNTSSESKSTKSHPTGGATLVNALDPSEKFPADAEGNLPPLDLAPFGFKILVPESEWKPLDPMVVSTSPDHDGFLDAAQKKISLRFDRPMDRASVEAALKTSSGNPAALEWDEAGSEVSLRAEGEVGGGILQVRLEAGARDLDGRTLHAPFETRFRVR
jgi:glycosidase